MLKRHPFRTRSAAAASLLLFAGACGSGAAKSGSSTPPPPAPAVTVSSPASFGSILTDGKGMTLYLFDKDEPIRPQSACTGACAQTWPLLTASDGHTVGAGLDAHKLGTAARPDGEIQLTYNNWPLYRFSGDTAPGQTNGQGIGGIWHVAGTDGTPITGTRSATTAPANGTGDGY